MSPKHDGNQTKRAARGNMIKVLVVTSHEVLQKALVDLIHQQPDIEVCAVVQDLNDLDRWLIGKDVTKVVIIDWPVSDHLKVPKLRELLTKYPKVRCLAICLYDDPFLAKQALDAGIYAYVTKCMAAETMSTAIRTLAAGQRYFSSDVLDMIPLSFIKEGVC